MSSCAVVLRAAEPADADAIAALSGQLGYPAAARDIQDRLVRLAGSPEHLVLVAVDGSTVIGWIHAAHQLVLEAGDRCEIVGLVVDREARGKGIGRQLVERVERWAGGRGLRLMSVRSAVTRAESHPFYERLGYERIKTSHTYRKRLGATVGKNE